ncbi:MAG: hypothetical protein HQL66_00790 [Magnetococcales bacterium]|nr:hypothetical protein [Magnetococcales bacterium]
MRDLLSLMSLTRDQAAALVMVSPSTLDAWISQTGGAAKRSAPAWALLLLSLLYEARAAGEVGEAIERRARARVESKKI